MVFLLVFIAAVAGTVIFTPISVMLARKFDVMDYPRARKVHRQPLPRWGGIGIYFGFIIAVSAAALLAPSFKGLLAFNGFELKKTKYCCAITHAMNPCRVFSYVPSAEPTAPRSGRYR